MERRKVKNGSSRRSLLSFVPYIFFRPFRLSLVPTICPWVSEDVLYHAGEFIRAVPQGENQGGASV